MCEVTPYMVNTAIVASSYALFPPDCQTLFNCILMLSYHHSKPASEQCSSVSVKAAVQKETEYILNLVHNKVQYCFDNLLLSLFGFNDLPAYKQCCN